MFRRLSITHAFLLSASGQTVGNLSLPPSSLPFLLLLVSQCFKATEDSWWRLPAGLVTMGQEHLPLALGEGQGPVLWEATRVPPHALSSWGCCPRTPAPPEPSATAFCGEESPESHSLPVRRPRMASPSHSRPPASPPTGSPLSAVSPAREASTPLSLGGPNKRILSFENDLR